MALVNQPSANPTNKLTAATVVSAVFGAMFNIFGLFLKNIYPDWYDPEILMSVNNAISTTAIFIVGWYVSDRANVVVITEQIE